MIKSGRISRQRLAEGIAAIERNARTQSRLIEELLDLSRMTSGKLQFEMAALNMSELVKDVVASMRHIH